MHRALATIATAAVCALVGGCAAAADEPYSFEGRYELVEVRTEATGCDGPLQSVPVPEKRRWFRLAEIEAPTGRLMASYACRDPKDCSEVHDLYYSFGRVAGAWTTSIYAAVKPPCQLSHTQRVLTDVDADTIQVESKVWRIVDDSVAPEACDYPLAKSRAPSMPCVEREVWTARRLR